MIAATSEAIGPNCGADGGRAADALPANRKLRKLPDRHRDVREAARSGYRCGCTLVNGSRLRERGRALAQ